jgi:uncharacterized protein (TIGR02996 family)
LIYQQDWMSNPPAHRRLVPRTTRKAPAQEPDPDPDDLDVTAKHVIIDVPDSRDPDVPLPSDSLEAEALEIESLDAEIETSEHAKVDAGESLEMTVQRHVDVEDSEEPLDSVDEDVDAAETFAFQQQQQAAQLAQHPSPLANLTVDHVSRIAPDNSFADSEPTNLKSSSLSGAPGVEDRPMAHVSPAEIGLLAAMSEGHEPSRLKYVDWLDRRGERSRAEFLRLDHALVTMSPDDVRHAWTRQRLAELAAKVSVDWRSRVARSLIENCTAYGSGCPAYWRALPADSDDVRRCNSCKSEVYYCVTIELARARVQNGQRVAVDITCDRWVGDLDPHCTACRQPVPAHTRFCPHCGNAL